MISSSNIPIVNSPPPLPLPPSSHTLPSNEKIKKKSIDERDRLFTLYENDGRIGDVVIDSAQEPMRLSLTDPNSIDQYGFIHDQPLKPLTINERKQLQQEVKRSERWNKMLKKPQQTFTRRNEQLRRRMYKGLPGTLRGAFWSRLLNLDEILRVNRGYYDLLKDKARATSTFLSQIDLDVNRTYRNHQMFRNRYSQRQNHLFSILAAYSVYNTEIGYTQGMNQIVAFLLFYLPEEEAFWAFCQLMTTTPWTMHGFFSPEFPKLLRFQAHFDKIMKKMLPKIYKHFRDNHVLLDIYTIRWFMLCYLDCLPFPLTLRLWDIFLLEGEEVLLTAAFCILRIQRKKILNLKSAESINTFLKEELRTSFASSSLTLDEIIEEYVVCYEKLKQNNLLALPPATEKELPSKPFNISMGDITKLNSSKPKKSSTPDEAKSSSPTSNQVSPSNGIAKSQVSPTTNSQKPVVQTFLVTSAAPLASMDEDFPMSVQLRDTTIEERYLEVRRRTKLPPVDGNSLVEYDSCTVLSSADPSMAGYRRTRNDNDFDNDTISSKSAPIDDNDEHAQISQMITASFMQPYSSSERFKRSPSFYDNVNEEDQLVHNYHRQQQQQYTFDTEIR